MHRVAVAKARTKGRYCTSHYRDLIPQTPMVDPALKCLATASRKLFRYWRPRSYFAVGIYDVTQTDSLAVAWQRTCLSPTL